MSPFVEVLHFHCILRNCLRIAWKGEHIFEKLKILKKNGLASSSLEDYNRNIQFYSQKSEEE